MNEDILAYTIEAKKEERAEIARQVKNFLANGGKIQSEPYITPREAMLKLKAQRNASADTRLDAWIK
jgi:hypothetical protein